MPSPFPGMDPFLEHPAHFPDLHDRLVAQASEWLQVHLPPPYYSVIGSRVWVETSHRSIGPDVHVLQPNGAGGNHDEAGKGGVALATLTRTKPLVITVPHDEYRETFIEIYSPLDNQERLVTVIEVLSLTNKTPGAHGRDLYIRKQQEIRYGEVHLIEIVLLRGGEHTTAVPLDRLRAKAPDFDYHVCTHLFNNLEDFFVYPVRLEESLPEIAVPLLPGDKPIPLDLQVVFERCYDAGPYRRRVRYNESGLVPPLKAEQWTWAKELLQQKGIAAAE